MCTKTNSIFWASFEIGRRHSIDFVVGNPLPKSMMMGSGIIIYIYLVNISVKCFRVSLMYKQIGVPQGSNLNPPLFHMLYSVVNDSGQSWNSLKIIKACKLIPTINNTNITKYFFFTKLCWPKVHIGLVNSRKKEKNMQNYSDMSFMYRAEVTLIGMMNLLKNPVIIGVLVLLIYAEQCKYCIIIIILEFMLFSIVGIESDCTKFHLYTFIF